MSELSIAFGQALPACHGMSILYPTDLRTPGTIKHGDARRAAALSTSTLGRIRGEGGGEFDTDTSPNRQADRLQINGEEGEKGKVKTSLGLFRNLKHNRSFSSFLSPCMQADRPQ